MTTTEITTEAGAATTRPTLTGIQHVGLTVRDVEASAEWYGRVLGLERQFEEAHHHSDEGGFAVVMGTPDMSMNVGLDHHPARDDDGFDPTRTGLDHLCFQVADVGALGAWAIHLDGHGVTHLRRVPDAGHADLAPDLLRPGRHPARADRLRCLTGRGRTCH